MKIKYIDYGAIKRPTRAHYNDAGLDCYLNESFEIQNGETKVIELGFGLEVPDGYVATIRPRSSINTKGIVTQIGTIDSGYRGEIKVALVNCDLFETYKFNKGDRICQIVIEPIVIADLVDELGEERGSWGFGSTGK